MLLKGRDMHTKNTLRTASIVATTAICTYVGTAYVSPGFAQQGTPSGQPSRGTPAAQPSNSQPPPNREPSAAPNQNQQQPGTTPQNPQNPSQVNPADVNNNNQNNQNNPNGTFTGSNNGFNGTQQGGINPNQNGQNANGQNLTQAQRLAQLRAERPFTFASPQAEARFNQSVQRLTALETRMNTANQNLLKRLGDLRTQSPDRQGAGMADLVQQMLLDQAEMQKYMVQARSIWTGNLEGIDSFGDEGLAGNGTGNGTGTGTPSNGGDATGTTNGTTGSTNGATGSPGSSTGAPANGTTGQPTNTSPPR
jgi:hypothetical protein